MKTVQVRVLQTSDTHGYVFPIGYSSKKPQDVGLAQISTLIQKYRNQNTILVDSGDTIQGSPLTYHHAKEKIHHQNPLSNIFNYMKYDFVTIGNHEFNYGQEYLGNFLRYLDAKIVNANIIDTTSSLPYIGKPYEIRVVENGPKIAIIGATTHYVPNWERPTNILDITFVDALESIKKTVKEVRELEHPDFIIVNYHGGFEKDTETHQYLMEDTGENQGYRIIEEVEGIDLLLTGHQHRTLAGKLFSTYYTQPSYNGTALGLVDITFTKNEDMWESKINEIKIIPTTGIEPDQNVLKIAMDAENETQLFLDTPIGKTKSDLVITNQLEARLYKHPLISFINQVQLAFSGAEISSCSLGNDVSGFKKNITIRDVIGTYIYPNTLVVKAVPGHVLKMALEKTAEFFEIEDNQVIISPSFNTPKLQLYAYDMYENIDYSIDLRKPHQQRIAKATYQGEDIQDQKIYSVVMNNYRASGGGDYLFFKSCKTIKDLQIDVIELLINYIYDKKEVSVTETHNIEIVFE